MPVADTPNALPAPAEWVAIVRPYQKANTRWAVTQVLTSIVPLVLSLWAALAGVHAGHYWALLATPVAGCMVIRAFIIQHDCGHGSFLASGRWNDRIGWLCSLFTVTPYEAWRHDHAVHHAGAACLQRRGTGDIRTLTVAEYRQGTRLQRWWYRFYRHPLAMLGIGPLLHFVFAQRWPFALPAKATRERRSVHLLNLALSIALVVLARLFGVGTLVLVLVPTIAIATSAGVYLFYVQHQFDPGFWADEADWSFTAAALRGSSCLVLPRALEWITGSIGYHHVHHLAPRVPNYRLRRCHEEQAIFQAVPQLTLRASLHGLTLALWDEQTRRLVSFREAAATASR